MFIEIAVAHLVDEAKRARLREQDWSCLEIRLERPLELSSRRKVEEAVIEDLGNRHWLSNRKLRPAVAAESPPPPVPGPPPVEVERIYHDLAGEPARARRFRERHQRPVRVLELDSEGEHRTIHGVDGCPLGTTGEVSIPGQAATLTVVETHCLGCAAFDGFTDRQERIICFGLTPVPDWYNFHRNRQRTPKGR